MKRSLTIIALLLPALALATNQPPEHQPPSSSQPIAVSSAGANAAAASAARADSRSNSVAGAVSDSASNAEQAQQQQQSTTQEASAVSGDATSSSGGNSQSTQFSYPKQAPSTAQGSLGISSCGAGGNAGGSNSRGSAFLGFAWTPKDCKLLLAAAAYESIGMLDSACEMVNAMKPVQARWKKLGVAPPSCQVVPTAPPVVAIPPVVPPVTVTVQAPDLSGYATKADVAASQKRQTEALVGK